MVLRQLGDDDNTRNINIRDSVGKAKEAVECDTSDGTSWCKYWHA